MTMKKMLRTPAWIGLLGFLLALPPDAWAATKAKSPAAPKPPATTGARPERKPSIARNPYLGAVVVDAATGKVLFEDQADAKGYPASVLKLMDLLIILERVQARQISLQDPVIASAKASKTGGSQVWLAEKEVFTIDELLYALMVQSANDAAVALAEKLAGSTEAFVELMNTRARELGMNSTRFQSAHGLPPGAGQEHDVTTARDFARLCLALLKHPDALRFTSTRERPFRPNAGEKTVIMRNHDHLLDQIEGCDGFKTGYIREAGYSIAVTAARKGQRVVAIVLGSLDRKVRDAKAAELVAKGFLALPGVPAAAVPPAPPAKTPVPVKR